ncbi:MAG: LEPR-XLL domain-containing protein, partial [Desulfobacteraceae bacterium]
MGLARQISRLRKAKEVIARRKRRKALMEPLEPRLLLDADLSLTPELDVTHVIDMAVADPYLEPFGSLVHTASTREGFISQGEIDGFSVSTDPGQTLTVAILPRDSSIQAKLDASGPDGSIHTAQAQSAGEPVFLHNLATGGDVGSFSISATSLEGTGEYDVVYWLNATVETENYGGPTNDVYTSALDISASALALPDGADRLAAVGKTDGTAPDHYAFALAAGQTVTLALSPTQADTPEGAVVLELLDPSGSLISMGDSAASNADQMIHNFIAPAAGTYYARVTGNADLEYTVLVTRGADFDLEQNGRAVNAQVLSGSGSILGNLGQLTRGEGLADTGEIAVIGNNDSASDAGLLAIVNQLNDHTYTHLTATLIRPDQADTLQELQEYDAVVVGGTNSQSNLAIYAPALCAYVEAGGGLVATGFVLADATSHLSDQTLADFDAVVPVNASEWNANNYFTRVTVAPTGTSPIVQGVGSFFLTYLTT